MARYEFNEGGSSKFWEIELSGAAFTVRWGRIGTQGQSQVKTFASEAKAAAEHAKLIAEKVGKGYSLVGSTPSTSAATPTATARPAAAPSVSVTPSPKAAAASPLPAPPMPAALRPELSVAPTTAGDVRVSWTDAARRKVHPRQGSGAKAPRIDGQKRFEQVAGRYVSVEPGWMKGEELATEECRALMQKVRARLTAAAPAPPLDVREEAATAAMLGAEYGPQADGFVDYWISVAGVAFATDALATSWSFDRPTRYDAAAGEISYLVTREPDSEGFRYGRTYGWRVLRRHLAAAAPDAYAAALVVARRHFEDAPTPLKCGLAYLFPTEADWSREPAEALMLASLPAYSVILLGAFSDAELAQRFVERLVPGHLNSTMCETPPQEHVFTLIDALGPGALSPVRKLFAMAEAAGDRRTFGEALAQLECAEVAALFQQHVDDKPIKGIVSEYFSRHPHLAHATLGEARGGAAAAVLKAATAEETVAASEAPASAIPGVLAAPPWLDKTKAKAPAVVAGLAPLEYAESIAWAPGEQARLAKDHGDNPKNGEWASQEIDNRIKADGSVNFFFLNRLVPEAAIVKILMHPPSAWYNPDPREIHQLIAVAEMAALPALLHLAAGAPIEALEGLARFDSARVAPAMADAFVRLKKARVLAERWLTSHVAAAAVGLIPDAVGAPGKPREAAGTALRWLAARGHTSVIAAAAGGYSAVVDAAVAEVLSQDPLALYPARLPRLPEFWKPSALPRPRLKQGGTLPLSALDHLATMLSFSPLDTPYAGLAEVKAACDERSLSAFTWELFEAWQRAGAPAKEQWALLALGHFGDDETARRLTPKIRAWPGESATARAVLALEVLAAIGTDLALMHLNGIAQKVKFKGLQDKAQEKIRQIAESRGMTDEELSDRLVPDLGLDPDGSRVLDFGARSFKVGFDEELRPFLRDSDNKPLTDLPKPGKSDDAAKAADAADAWKALKKDARAISSDQVVRLERVMCSRRRWDVSTWRTLLLEHPVLGHLVRRLVWGVYDSTGLRASFRVAEDASLAGVDDKPFAIAGDAFIGIAHALELDAGTAEAWGRLFSEYQIVQPFPQLGRRSYTPTPAETTALALARFANRTVDVGRVLGLVKRGWRKADALDGGVALEMTKAMGNGVQAVLPLDPGIYLGDPRVNAEQALGEVTLEDEQGKKLPLGSLDAVAFSELLFDVDGLGA